MAGIGDPIRELLRFALTGGDFSISLWIGMTFLLLLVGATLAAVAPKVLDPIAVEVALRPGRILLWIPISLTVLPLTIVLLIYSWVGIPLGATLLITLPFVGGVGYLAMALIAGDRLARAYGRDLPPWGAIAVGIVVFRLVRALPFVGAALHSALWLFGLAAVMAVLWTIARAWHARRMPDREQFRDESLIEWYPPEEPEPPVEPPAWKR